MVQWIAHCSRKLLAFGHCCEQHESQPLCRLDTIMIGVREEVVLLGHAPIHSSCMLLPQQTGLSIAVK